MSESIAKNPYTRFEKKDGKPVLLQDFIPFDFPLSIQKTVGSSDLFLKGKKHTSDLYNLQVTL
ncbi:hypothetical protein [Leptospira alexanderi]|uniref:Uncharacterized protein n=1 Tax=Leptospira alexanderi serovar Manhao 3 str. L 60 TaxID=1049759 RepID=V6HZG7_9LEPT|nr:hypothetical protein [Leptospira alexanderi]EQA63315.1 hypothetical protein LEP1GSC062_4500 [Leptospira alexanderi serovar Manhao 3 str. L 60]